MAKMDWRPEVVTFGETMALFMPDGHAGIEHASRMQKSFGGAESNVAIGLARLGHQVGWFGYLGDDPLGRDIYKRIRGEGVDVSRSKLLSDAPTGMMLRETPYGRVSVYYYRKHSAASLMSPEDLDEGYIASAKMLHITGITPALSPSCREAVTAAIGIAKKHGVKVCFDPNLRLKLWSAEEARETILEYARLADYFLPGLDELRHLFGTEDVTAHIQRLHELSAVSVVKGDGLTYVVENSEVHTVEWFKAERFVDPIGAGDGFAAGFIAGILQGKSPEDAARMGNLVGSLVVQEQGDWEALPTREHVESVLNNQQHVER